MSRRFYCFQWRLVLLQRLKRVPLSIGLHARSGCVVLMGTPQFFKWMVFLLASIRNHEKDGTLKRTHPY